MAPPAAAAGAVDAVEAEADGEVLALADAGTEAAALAESAWVCVAGGLLAAGVPAECELLLQAVAQQASRAIAAVAARVLSRMVAPNRGVVSSHLEARRRDCCRGDRTGVLAEVVGSLDCDQPLAGLNVEFDAGEHRLVADAGHRRDCADVGEYRLMVFQLTPLVGWYTITTRSTLGPEYG